MTNGIQGVVTSGESPTQLDFQMRKGTKESLCDEGNHQQQIGCSL